MAIQIIANTIKEIIFIGFTRLALNLYWEFAKEIESKKFSEEIKAKMPPKSTIIWVFCYYYLMSFASYLFAIAVIIITNIVFSDVYNKVLKSEAPGMAPKPQ